MPPKFDTGNWEDYIFQFDMVCELNGWKANNEKKCLILGICLQGMALDEYKQLSPEVRGDYDAVVKALSQKFMPIERVQLEKLKFLSKTCKDGESLTELASFLKGQVSRAYPLINPAGQAELALDRFVDALPTSIRLLVRQTAPTTLDAALSSAMQQEAAAEVEKKSRHHVNAAGLGSANERGAMAAPGNADLQVILRANTEAMTSMAEAVSRLISQQLHPEAGQRTGSKKKGSQGCWTCGQVGHLKSACPSSHHIVQNLPQQLPQQYYPQQFYPPNLLPPYQNTQMYAPHQFSGNGRRPDQ